MNSNDEEGENRRNGGGAACMAVEQNARKENGRENRQWRTFSLPFFFLVSNEDSGDTCLIVRIKIVKFQYLTIIK